jgi:hypothetical protein
MSGLNIIQTTGDVIYLYNKISYLIKYSKMHPRTGHEDPERD